MAMRQRTLPLPMRAGTVELLASTRARTMKARLAAYLVAR
jgi:hypothetical protein